MKITLIIVFLWVIPFVGYAGFSSDSTVKTKPIQDSAIDKLKASIKEFDDLLRYSESSIELVKHDLQIMGNKDSLVRKALYQALSEKEKHPELFHEVWKVIRDSDVSNGLQLHALIDRYGWIDSTRFGFEAERNAWLIAQHMVHDQGKFQRYVLLKMVENGNYNKVNYALLSDRVNVMFDKVPQSYGSQGKCDDKGHWNPSPIKDEHNLDQRRQQIGLESFADYSKRLNSSCAGRAK